MTIREQVSRKILGAIPDARVEVVDLTGTDNHLEARVVSASFAGKSAIERHRMVYSSLREWIDDDTVHALAIRTWTPDQLGAATNDAGTNDAGTNDEAARNNAEEQKRGEGCDQR